MKTDENGAKTMRTEVIGRNSAPTEQDYSQGCLALKKEEQSRATNCGLIGVRFIARMLELKKKEHSSNWRLCSKEIWRGTTRILTITVRVGGINRMFLGEVKVKGQQQSSGFQIGDTSITPGSNLENLVSKYINLVDAGVESMEAVQRSQITSTHNMDNQIELLAKMIVERPLSSLPSNTEHIKGACRGGHLPECKRTSDDISHSCGRRGGNCSSTGGVHFPEEEEAPQRKSERRHNDLLRLKEPPHATTVVEESERDKHSVGNKSEFKEDEQEKENKSLLESQRSHTEE
ncbi:hypothetical protein M9H77_30063 [Catharanthus roseus]|uniref:Uncharacterized protein n=1 Tax=Catharanthus roseus TaxID=4058 RepID=A0ACC0A039_CATRO|nr:hypothetical protein M9H77_30063 [Catharanthus roseus]